MAISKQQPLRPYVQELGDAVDTIADKIDDGEIISAGAVEAFGTVAQMQAATYLTAGMVCHTNGFHSEGDGGAAYYSIGATGTANGMDVLELQGDLFATLVVTEPYVTPEQFGAYGDGTHDDTTSIQTALSKYKMVKGANSYSITSVDVTGCDLELNRVGSCSIVSNGAQDKPSKVSVKYAETLTLGTFKNSSFAFGFVKTLNVAPTNSFAYNKVTYGRCNTLNIGVTGQAYWCNANQFWGRVVNGIAFLGTYGHNCNYIYCSSEGGGFTITSESAIHDNIFDLYGENVTSEHVSFNGYNNVLKYRHISYAGASRNTFGDVYLNNVVSHPSSDDLLKMLCESHIETLDQNTGLTIAAYTAYENHLISVAENETVYIIFDSDVAGFRNRLFAYDANMQPVDLSTVFTDIKHDIANAIRQNDSEVNRLEFTNSRNADRITLPYKQEIKYWQFQVYHYTGGPFYFINTKFYSTGSKSLVSKIGTVLSSI